MHDITERKRFEGQLQYLADHDALTGMFNRRRFEQELERELARRGAYGTGGAVLAIDLDHFKYVNDTHGHSVGDELIARVGVDLPAAAAGDGRDRAPRRRRVLGDPARRRRGRGGGWSPRACSSALREEGSASGGPRAPRWVTASIGIAPFGAAATSGEEVLVEADIAMYDAKEAGRDRFEVYDSAQRAPGADAGAADVGRPDPGRAGR